MSENQTNGGAEADVVSHAAESSDGWPLWLWALLGFGTVAVLAIVLSLLAANQDELEKAYSHVTPSPSPSASVSPSPSPSPSPSESAEPSPSPSPSDTSEPSPEPTETIQPPAESFGDGTWEVGTDIAAGTYRTKRPIADGAAACQWLLQGEETSPKDNLVAGPMVTGGIPTVTVTDGDVLGTKNCGEWGKVDPDSLFDPDNIRTSIKPGVWLVGEDIAAGTYISKDIPPTEDIYKACLWRNAVSLDNNFTTTIGYNAVMEGQAKVVLESGQQFYSIQCGEWTKIDK